MKKINLINKDIKEKKFKKLFKRFYREFLRKIFKLQSSKNKVKILEEKWDNLIVLDACRYDYFKEIYSNYLKGKLEKKLSLGTNTKEWLGKNFNKKTDIVYISSNPFVNNLKRKKEPWNKNFYKIISLWNTKWDENLDSVHPKEVVKIANDIDKKYPNQRKIIHFMQPHLPYLNKSKEFNKKIFEKSREGKLNKKDIEEMKEAYRENLKIVLKELKNLKLKGKTIVTADHGELFGEHGLYLHHAGIYFKELVEIPWFVMKKSKKEKIVDKIKI
ncbi:hypothetical protein JW949_01280 [Candidatus Woesearchaeota archaeon]|nr:hypothetical protein [Candidatus Woesearchaeota archaeon]